MFFCNKKPPIGGFYFENYFMPSGSRPKGTLSHSVATLLRKRSGACSPLRVLLNLFRKIITSYIISFHEHTLNNFRRIDIHCLHYGGFLLVIKSCERL